MNTKFIPEKYNNKNATFMEHNFVFLTYEKIAQRFSDTRFKVWDGPAKFIINMKSKSRVVEVGCGNGKNMKLRNDLDFYGCDISKEFVKMCKNDNLNVIVGNNLNLPYESNFFDYTLSIAVIHHLYNENNRIKAINELFRITKPGGLLFIEVWAFEQGEESKFNFEKQDLLIPFKDKVTREILGERYYHLFSEFELENILKRKDNCEIIEKFAEKGNWCYIIKKKVT